MCFCVFLQTIMRWPVMRQDWLGHQILPTVHTRATSIPSRSAWRYPTSQYSKCWAKAALERYTLYKGYSETSQTNTDNQGYVHHILSLQCSFLQLKCTWSGICLKLGFHCKGMLDLLVFQSAVYSAYCFLVISKLTSLYEFFYFWKQIMVTRG